MDDLISRQAAIDALVEILDRPNHAEFLYGDEICGALGSLPSAQPERKKGKWMEENTRSASYIFKCSCCGKNAYFVHGKGRGRNCENRYCGYDYCPNCGADMRGK